MQNDERILMVRMWGSRNEARHRRNLARLSESANDYAKSFSYQPIKSTNSVMVSLT